MKEASYVVNLSFSEHLSKSQCDHITERILDILENTVHKEGLIPKNAPGFTQVITVQCLNSNAFIGRDLCTGDLV